MTTGIVLVHLGGVAQHYDWGKAAQQSLVASLAGLEDCGLPCAEYWIGDHSNGPAQILNAEPSPGLNELLRSNPDFYLGTRARQIFGDQLPFLFKVLSIAEPLSIQCHPDKALALKLHRSDPKHYPDENHKPEIAIALSKLTALQGFREPVQITTFFTGRSALRRALLPQDLQSLEDSQILQSHENSELLRIFSETLFRRAKDEIKLLCDRLRRELAQLPEILAEDYFALRSLNQFPGGDPGVFCYYLLKLKEFAVGEALFTTAGVPHAYLDGELVECMARSDNTIRAGLTSKFCDVETLLKCLDYRPLNDAGVQIQISDPSRVDYFTNASEFQVQRIIFENPTDLFYRKSLTPQLFFCLKGKASLHGSKELSHNSTSLLPGQACLIAAGVPEWNLREAAGEFYLVQVPDK